MPKPLAAIIVLCLCILALTAVATPPARAADDAKDPIKLPAFHKQTVKIDGKDVPIDVRWFDKPMVVGSTDTNTLPASATKTWIAADQDLIHENYAAYVSRFVDTKAAQKYVDDLQDAAKGHHAGLKGYQDLLRGVDIIGEARVGSYDLAVAVFQEKQVRAIVPVCAARADDKYRLVAEPFRQDDAGRLISVRSMIEKGKLAPPTIKEEKNQD